MSKFDITGDCIIRNQDPLILYNGSGNVNLKMQNASYSRRWELNSSGQLYLWNESNVEIFHIDASKEIWANGPINSSSGFYQSGVPITSSSKLKREIKNIEDNNLFDKLKFKKYIKQMNDEGVEHNEYGLIAQDLIEMDPENENGFWTQKKDRKGEMVDYVYYHRIFSLMGYEVQKLKNKLNNYIECSKCKCLYNRRFH